MVEETSLTQLQIDYLHSLNIDIATISQAVLSDVNSLQSCYDWYITDQKVSTENAFLASKAWVQKYALHDENGVCLEKTPEDMWKRLANSLAAIEIRTNKINKDFDYWYTVFYATLKDWKAVPGGSALSVVGNNYINSSASNCFVVGTEDSLEGIMQTASDMARLQSYRGGTGLDISTLRPASAPVHNSARFSTGAVSFMDFFSKVTSTIGQAGRSGATMISMNSFHPDIERFIDEKQDLDKQWFFDELRDYGINIEDWKYTSISSRLKSTTKANVSIKAYDDFMKSVENDTDYELHYEFKDNKYPRISKIVKGRDIWNKFIAANVKSAEPGIIFWDTVIRESVSDCYAGKKKYQIPFEGKVVEIEHDLTTVSTNPCSELPLPVGSACTLLSMNLPKYVKYAWTDKASFDYKAFREDVRIATRMLDNIKEYDVDKLPLKINKLDAVMCRRIGLGCHGLADCLASMGYKYDTDAAVDRASDLYKVLANTVYDESVTLGQEKGNFPIWNWELEKKNPFLNRLNPDVLARIKKFGRRNIACLTNAPTGTLSIVSRNCSSGIEPVFKKEYLRNVKKQNSEETVQHLVYHQAIQDCIDSGGDTSVFVEANNIKWEYRVKMQSAIQKYIDHSISSTVNLPEGTTEETVSNIYMTAWKSGLKGITVYVDGSRTGVLISNNKKPVGANQVHKVIERPKSTNIDIHKTKYKDKNYMILVGKTPEGQLVEVFGGEESDGLSLPTKYHSATLTKKSRGQYTLSVQLSKDDPEDILKINNISNRFPAQDIITLTRMISLSLRNGISVSEIVEQLTKSATNLYDAPAVFARILKQYISDEEIITRERAKNKPCPECGSELDYKRESGCLTELCTSCSYSNSKCG